MEIHLVRNYAEPSSAIVTIENKGEKLIWSVSAFSPSNFDGGFDMFQQTNEFLAQLPEKQRDDIFNVFKEIRVVFDNDLTKNNLSKTLTPLVTKLYDVYRFEDVTMWVKFRSDIQYPTTGLEKEYVESNERPSSRVQTYLFSDYQALVCLTMSLRLMIPIWGEYISRTKAETGTNFKEYYAYQLITESALAECEPMEKLIQYVLKAIPNERPKSAIIGGGVSSEDFPTLVLGGLLVKKLAISDFRGVDPKISLITYIYNHVKDKVRRSDDKFDGSVKDKKAEGNGVDGENQMSKIEGYKVKQEVTPGDLELLSYAVKDIHDVAMRLCPTLDRALLDSALKSSTFLQQCRIHDPQVFIMQWVMKPIIGSRGAFFLPKTDVIRCLAATQAILMHQGHKELAGLVTAASRVPDETDVTDVVSRLRIPKDMLEELTKYYPHIKKNTKAKSVKAVNHAVASIDSITDQLSQKNWVLTMEDKFLQPLTGSTTLRRYQLPPDIKIKLASLVLELVKRPRNRASANIV